MLWILLGVIVILVLPREPRFLEFVRLPSFERTVDAVLSEDDIRELELVLLQEPRTGRVVQDTGGVRKVRAAPEGRGKRGGACGFSTSTSRRARRSTSCSAIPRTSRTTSRPSRPGAFGHSWRNSRPRSEHEQRHPVW